MMRTKARPTISNSTSVAFFLILVQMSIEKIVEEELKIEVREDMRAASITASISPERPEISKSDVIALVFKTEYALFRVKETYKGHKLMR